MGAQIFATMRNKEALICTPDEVANDSFALGHGVFFLLPFGVALRDHLLSRGSAQGRGEREASQMSGEKQVAAKPRISPSR